VGSSASGTGDDASLLGHDQLHSSGGGEDSVAISIPPRWMSVIDEIKHDIGRIETQCMALT
jgi:hypothetical protein